MSDTLHYYVTDVIYGNVNKKDCQLTLTCHDVRFNVTLRVRKLREPGCMEPSPLEHHYLKLLRAIWDDTDDRFDRHAPYPYPEEAMYEWVVRALFPVIRDLAPKPLSRPHMLTLKEYLSPPTFFYTLEGRSGKLTPIRQANDPEVIERLIPRIKLDGSFFPSDLPVIRPASLTLPHDIYNEGSSRPQLVFLDGDKSYYCKFTERDHQRRLKREIEVLLRLRESGLSDKIRVPKLHGYLQYEGDSNWISGTLQTRIKHTETLDGWTHQTALLPQKQKWYDDIEAMLTLMHENSIVWGDAKADNILLDTDGEVWIVDFGGSYTPGWVDADKMETIEGDLQGLSRIKEHLRLDEEDIRFGSYYLPAYHDELIHPSSCQDQADFRDLDEDCHLDSFEDQNILANALNPDEPQSPDSDFPVDSFDKLNIQISIPKTPTADPESWKNASKDSQCSLLDRRSSR